MHVHKRLSDIVLRISMLSFTEATIILATVAHMYLEMFSTTNVSRFTPASWLQCVIKVYLLYILS